MKKLSRLAAGTMNWGVWDKALSTNGMSNLMHTCIDSGLTTFDHADIYGGYTTEAEFGNAFVWSGISRSDFELVTKCGIQHLSGNRDNKVKHYDYSKDYIIWSANTSLQNLKTDYLDLFLLHRPSPLMQADEVAEAVAKLMADGKILSFGVSNFTPSQTDLIRQAVEVSYNQIEFSATHVEPMTDGGLDHMQLNNITPMAWSPLGKVFRENSEQSQRLIKLLDTLQEKYTATADVILLAWILKHPSGIIPVCGTASPERIKKLPKATEIQLGLEDWFAIWEESRGSKVP